MLTGKMTPLILAIFLYDNCDFLLILVLKRPSRSFGKVLYGVGCFGIWLMWGFDQLSIAAAGRLIFDSRVLGGTT